MPTKKSTTIQPLQPLGNTPQNPLPSNTRTTAYQAQSPLSIHIVNADDVELSESIALTGEKILMITKK